MKVCYAAPVTAGMETYLSLNLLSDSPSTIMFISDIDKLFDILNSKHKYGSKSYNRPFINRIEQKNHLLKMQNTFKNLVVFDKKKGNDVTNLINFSNSWQFSIADLPNLWNILKSKIFQVLIVYILIVLIKTARKIIFGTFRKNSNNINPTSYEFLYTFKKRFCLIIFNILMVQIILKI